MGKHLAKKVLLIGWGAAELPCNERPSAIVKHALTPLPQPTPQASHPPTPVRPPNVPPAGPTRDEDNEFITVVSGLPRSGTSMMMQMLHAGGHPCLSDEQRLADTDNPRGYFEYEKVKHLRRDASWLPQAKGKAVKIIAQLLPFLPPQFNYRVIFMERELDEVISSQNQMLQRQGRSGGDLSDERLRQVFEGQVQQIKQMLTARKIPTLYVAHRDALERPMEIAGQVVDFLGRGLDVQAMAGVIDPNLYRQRREQTEFKETK